MGVKFVQARKGEINNRLGLGQLLKREVNKSKFEKEVCAMKKNKGIAILLFAILLQTCSTGMEALTLGIGAVGLVVAIIDDIKKD